MNLNNYGIKRMLPRLIIAAILVNLSFVLCLVAVDVSNIVGSSAAGLFDSIGADIQSANTSSAAAPNGWDGAVTAILIAGMGVGLVILIILAPSVLLILAAIWLILMARQAFIILLIVISPLAFVAYLLPNTEQWFKKWWKMFSTLLLLFPIIAVVFGAASLASLITFEVADKDDQSMAIIALGIQAIPLFAVPVLLKGAMSAAGGLGAKLQSLTDRAQKGSISNSRIGAYKKAYDRNKEIKRAQIHGGVYRGKNPVSRLNSLVSRGANRATGRVGTQVAQQGAALANKLQVESVEAANAQIQEANIPNDALREIAMGGRSSGINGGDAGTRAAAMIELTRRGEFQSAQDSWNDMVNTGNSTTRQTVAQAFSRSSDRPGFIGQGQLGQIARGESNAQFEELAAAGGYRYSAESVATTTNEELRYVATSAQAAGNQQTLDDLEARSNEAINHPEISRNIGNNRRSLEALSNGQIPPP